MKMFVGTEWQDGMKICMLVYILSVLLHSTNLTLIDFDVYKSFL